MGLLVYLFDTRDFSPEKKSEIYNYIDRDAFMSNNVVVDNSFVGFVAYYERDPTPFLANTPYQYPYKDVTGWDLGDMDYAFRVAFKVQS